MNLNINNAQRAVLHSALSDMLGRYRNTLTGKQEEELQTLLISLRDGASKDTDAWFKAAFPNPTVAQWHSQLGCHLEEVAEQLESIFDAGDKKGNSQLWAMQAIGDTIQPLRLLSELLKSGALRILALSHQDFGDSLADQRVTGTGLAIMSGYDFAGMIALVDRANFSKFVDGKPIYDEHGKVAKGPSTFKPDLGPYIINPIKLA